MGTETVVLPGGKIGLGIVGCGAIAGIHARAIREMDCAELVSVYSRHIENARRLAREYGVSAHDNWDEFVDDERLHIVSVCSPSGTHLDYGKKIAAAQKHVVVEKPIEVSLERGQELVRCCERNGVALAVIFQNRFLPEVMEMKKMVEDGAVGDILLAHAEVKWFRNQEYYDGARWRGTLELDGGGVLINQAIHTIDLLQWFLGRVELVFGQTGTYTHDSIEGEDNAVACARFENGALAVIAASTSVLPARDRKIELHGERGTLLLDGNILRVLKDDFPRGKTEASAGSRGIGAASPLQNVTSTLHKRQFEAILHALRRGEKPPVSGEESMKSLAIVQGIYLSAKRGLPIKISDLVK